MLEVETGYHSNGTQDYQLHKAYTKSPPTIVPHGNLKASDVLLDENDVVLVSDYDLSSLIAQPIAVQRMVVYKSPEYGYARRVTMHSDV